MGDRKYFFEVFIEKHLKPKLHGDYNQFIAQLLKVDGTIWQCVDSVFDAYVELYYYDKAYTKDHLQSITDIVWPYIKLKEGGWYGTTFYGSTFEETLLLAIELNNLYQTNALPEQSVIQQLYTAHGYDVQHITNYYPFELHKLKIEENQYTPITRDTVIPDPKGNTESLHIYNENEAANPLWVYPAKLDEERNIRFWPFTGVPKGWTGYWFRIVDLGKPEVNTLTPTTKP